MAVNFLTVRCFLFVNYASGTVMLKFGMDLFPFIYSFRMAVHSFVPFVNLSLLEVEMYRREMMTKSIH